MGWEEAVRPSSDGPVIEVEPKPGSSAPGGVSYDHWRKRLRVALAERAEGGRANDELLEGLSTALEAPESALSPSSGARGRSKSVIAHGLSRAEALRRLSSAVGTGATRADEGAGRRAFGRREDGTHYGGGGS